MSVVFICHNLAFAEFYRFVRHKDKKEFDSVCKELTGEGCGYKPEDAVPKKRTQSHVSSLSGTCHTSILL